VSGDDAYYDKYRCPSVSNPHDSYYRTHNNKCYLFVNTERHWSNARDDCSSKGGHLVIILDQATQTFIEKSLRDLNWNRNGVWLGLNDIDTEGHWKWVTGIDHITNLAPVIIRRIKSICFINNISWLISC